CDHQPALAKGDWNYFETPRVFAPDLVNDLWPNDHRGDVNPIHVRLCSQRARDIHLGQSSVADQNVEDTRLAVETRARVIDLMARDEPSLLKDSKHILFVVLHRGKRCGQFSLNRLYFQQLPGTVLITRMLTDPPILLELAKPRAYSSVEAVRMKR